MRVLVLDRDTGWARAALDMASRGVPGTLSGLTCQTHSRENFLDSETSSSAATAGSSKASSPRGRISAAEKQRNGREEAHELAKAGIAKSYPGLVCPLTGSLLREPMIAPDGYTYERSFIERWVRQYHASPKTGQPIILSDLRFNDKIRSHIDTLMAEAGCEGHVNQDLKLVYRIRR